VEARGCGARAELGDLRLELLRIVLAEVALPSGERGEHRRGGLALRHGDERHGADSAAAAARGRVHARPHGAEPLGDPVVHGGTLLDARLTTEL